MTESRTLLALAVLRVNFDRSGRDFIDTFVPFVADCLKRAPRPEISLPELQACIHDEYGLAIPQAAMSTILRRAARAGLARRDRGVYVRDSEALAAVETVAGPREAARAQFRGLLQALPWPTQRASVSSGRSRTLRTHSSSSSRSALPRCWRRVSAPLRSSYPTSSRLTPTMWSTASLSDCTRSAPVISWPSRPQSKGLSCRAPCISRTLGIWRNRFVTLLFSGTRVCCCAHWVQLGTLSATLRWSYSDSRRRSGLLPHALSARLRRSAGYSRAPATRYATRPSGASRTAKVSITSLSIRAAAMCGGTDRLAQE